MEDEREYCDGCRSECEHCRKHQAVISECHNITERQLKNIRKECKEDTDKEIAQLEEKFNKQNAELNNLCLTLSARINSIGGVVLCTAILSLLIAVIGLVLCICNAVYGCECNDKLSTWGIISMVLGGISFMLSVIQTIIVFIADIHKAGLTSSSQKSVSHKKINYPTMICAIITVINLVILILSVCLNFAR